MKIMIFVTISIEIELIYEKKFTTLNMSIETNVALEYLCVCTLQYRLVKS